MLLEVGGIRAFLARVGRKIDICCRAFPKCLPISLRVEEFGDLVPR